MKGAKTTVHVSFNKPPDVDVSGPAPTRGTDVIPRRMYLKPADFLKHGYTDGCPGCIMLRDGSTQKRNHTEACRARVEELIIGDAEDGRAAKVKERHDHFAHRKGQEEEEKKREKDPRQHEPQEPKADEEVAMEVIDGDDVQLDEAPVEERISG